MKGTIENLANDKRHLRQLDNNEIRWIHHSVKIFQAVKIEWEFKRFCVSLNDFQKRYIQPTTIYSMQFHTPSCTYVCMYMRVGKYKNTFTNYLKSVKCECMHVRLYTLFFFYQNIFLKIILSKETIKPIFIV